METWDSIPPRGLLPEKLSGGVRPAQSKTLTLFMTKLCDFPYRIFDLTKNSTPYFWPDTVARKHNLWRAFADGLIDNDKKETSSKKHTQFKTRVQKLYPIQD